MSISQRGGEGRRRASVLGTNWVVQKSFYASEPHILDHLGISEARSWVREYEEKKLVEEQKILGVESNHEPESQKVYIATKDGFS